MAVISPSIEGCRLCHERRAGNGLGLVRPVTVWQVEADICGEGSPSLPGSLPVLGKDLAMSAVMNTVKPPRKRSHRGDELTAWVFVFPVVAGILCQCISDLFLAVYHFTRWNRSLRRRGRLRQLPPLYTPIRLLPDFKKNFIYSFGTVFIGCFLRFRCPWC